MVIVDFRFRHVVSFFPIYPPNSQRVDVAFLQVAFYPPNDLVIARNYKFYCIDPFSASRTAQNRTLHTETLIMTGWVSFNDNLDDLSHRLRNLSARTPFTKDDDLLLMKYIARYNPDKSGRQGNALYQKLEANVCITSLSLIVNVTLFVSTWPG